MSAPDPVESPSALTSDDPGAKQGRWNSHIRRARIGGARKTVSLTFGSYADADGRGIYCGVARLAVDCEIGYSTARRYLAWLRDTGLAELVRPGNHKAGRADEYRLTLGHGVFERLDIPEEDEYKKLIEAVNASNRSGEKSRRIRDLRSPIESAVTTDDTGLSAPTMQSAETGHLRSPGMPSALTQGEPPPSTNYLPSTSDLPSGGTLPPHPLRPQDPPTSGLGTDQQNSLSEPVTQHQDLESELRPHAHADEAAGARLTLIGGNPDAPSDVRPDRPLLPAAVPAGRAEARAVADQASTKPYPRRRRRAG
jgi:DNA-binding transcriptional ArsR family regulator